jgi:hypothetical protein
MIQNTHLSGLLKQISEKEEVTDFLIILHGNFNQEVVTSSVKLIEDKCRNLNYSNSLITRLKMVSVEILQNITKHQHLSKEMLPYFIIGSNTHGVSIYSGNVVSNVSKNVISDRLNVYSSLDAEQLRSFYRDSLKNTSVSEAGNAGIGLLDIVYRSNQQVNFNFHDYKDDLYYFGLNVTIKNTDK